MPRVKLRNKVEVAEGTIAFYFDKPAGFQFKAGQFGEWALVDPPETDAEENSRTFTIASAPAEQDLMITTRMRDSAFKRSLRKAPAGTEVELDGPFGALVLHDDAMRPAVFLAGGIGITPFRSMVLDATQAARPHRLLLFYSNRRPEDAAFLNEFAALEKQNPQFTLVATMTDMANSTKAWKGETGHIDGAMLSKHVPDLAAPIYYTAGPPPMVAAMRKMLSNAGINAQNIRSEDFLGY